MRMKNIVAPNHFRIRIRQERKGITHFLRMAAIDLDGVNADRRDVRATRCEIGETILKTPQLGVTKRSPMSAVKNQDGAV